MLYELVCYGIDFLIFAIVFASVLPLFRLDQRSLLVRATRAIVDPLLYLISLVLPSSSMIDFSLMVALMILLVLKKLLNGS